MADDDQIIPLFIYEPDWAATLRTMKSHNIPVSRENCIRLLCFDEPPDPWTGECEDQLPPSLRGGDERKPRRSRGYLALSPEEFEDDLKHN